MKYASKSTNNTITNGKLKNSLDPHDKGSLKYILFLKQIFDQFTVSSS